VLIFADGFFSPLSFLHKAKQACITMRYNNAWTNWQSRNIMTLEVTWLF